MERRYRLAHRGQFQRVRSQGRSWSHLLLVLLAAENGLPYSRFGFLVSKRIGKAVVRNRVKRLMREAMRMRLHEVSSGWDIVLIARTPIVEADFWRIGEALDSLLQRAGLKAKPVQTVDISQ
ncbi:MAG: ribonuclease P protein component [Chloroflexi bacterium]|nr:ribonuclease P protein component [Chloroflexota bacterium]